jgi:putative CocE/NonD family hydrolase
MTTRWSPTLALVLIAAPAALPAQAPAGAHRVRERYEKREHRIAMRDGTRLFTSVYLPRDTSRTYPILMTRTPYSVAPYGDTVYRAALGPSGHFQDEGFIFVYQDVRGRWMSEGAFTHMTPHRAVKRGVQDVDESTDAYDTIEWLLANLPRHNGRVGMTGISYPGFYTSAGCIDAHPALVACSPQAPVTDMAQGDDAYHNGAPLLAHFVGFHAFFARSPRPGPGPDPRYPPPTGNLADGYQWFLGLGPAINTERRVFQGTAPLWAELMRHHTYDDFWKARDLRPHLKGMKPATLIVGGLYDAEDLWGTWAAYQAVERQSPGAVNTIVMGPWYHGQWNRDDGASLGHAWFGARTSVFFRDSVQFPFFMHYLKGAPRPDLPEALIFETGTNTWRRYPAWPPRAAERRSLYLQAGGRLTFDAPPAAPRGEEYDHYVSDPAKPVPLVDWITEGMPREYMTADQRFAARRPDVLVYQTEPLDRDLTILGPVSPVLHVATSGTDADFIVKLIDVFPDDAPRNPADSGFVVAGYQQLVRGEPFRGRFRRSFERPEPFRPDRPDSIRFTMPDINHTFRRGHRIMVQIQSSWFPFTDRNPQTFVPNIFEAPDSAYRPATMRLYRAAARPTRIEVLVM